MIRAIARDPNFPENVLSDREIIAYVINKGMGKYWLDQVDRVWYNYLYIKGLDCESYGDRHHITYAL